MCGSIRACATKQHQRLQQKECWKAESIPNAIFLILPLLILSLGITIYALVEKNNFFLLAGCTSMLGGLSTLVFISSKTSDTSCLNRIQHVATMCICLTVSVYCCLYAPIQGNVHVHSMILTFFIMSPVAWIRSVCGQQLEAYYRREQENLRGHEVP